MCRQIKSNILILTACLLLVSVTYSREPLDSEIEKLRKTDHVAGSAVYIGGGPGVFFTSSKVFLQEGSMEDFLMLTSDKSPVVRCMGLFCLAHRRESLKKLKEHLSDYGIIQHFPGGCIGTTTTVGGFARKLLLDPSHLGHRGSHQPLISEDGLISLDIEILAKDKTSGIHNVARTELHEALSKKKISLNLPDLKVRAPHLENYEIIKAIGRLGITPQTGRFLISCGRDENLDGRSRLAAFSALTRSKSGHMLNIIKMQRDQLNSLEESNWGDYLIETAQIRLSHEKLVTTIRAENARREPEAAKDKVILALSDGHPLTLTYFKCFLSLVRRDDDVRSTFKKSLVTMLENTQKFKQSWNTYSDTPYALHFMMESRGIYHRFNESERLELKTIIQKAMNHHFEE